MNYVLIIEGWSDHGMKYKDEKSNFFFFNIQDFSSLLEMASFLFVIQIALQGGRLPPPLTPKYSGSIPNPLKEDIEKESKLKLIYKLINIQGRVAIEINYGYFFIFKNNFKEVELNMEKTYAEIVNEKRNVEKRRHKLLVKEFEKKGHYLEDLGEEKYHNRYRFTSMALINEKIELIKNHVNSLEDLENILKLLATREIGEYKVRFIKLILDEAPDEEYSYLMTEMESKYNIPLINYLGWNEKYKDVIILYKFIANQRNFKEEQEDD